MDRFWDGGKVVSASLAVLLLAIILGNEISTRSNYDLLPVISTIFTAGILLVGLYRVLSDTPVLLEEQVQENRDETSPDSPDETVDSTRIGPTSGLRPEERSIQNALLKIAFGEFEGSPFAFMLTYRAPQLVEEVAEREGAETETVARVWQFCKDDEFFRKRGNSWRFTPKALFRVEEIGLDVLIDDAIQEEILDSLLQEYRNDPHHPRVTEETLVRSYGDEKKVLQNLWYLCEKGYVERESYVGGNAHYEITDMGRRAME